MSGEPSQVQHSQSAGTTQPAHAEHHHRGHRDSQPNQVDRQIPTPTQPEWCAPIERHQPCAPRGRRGEEAVAAFAEALGLVRTAAERRFLERRINETAGNGG